MAPGGHLAPSPETKGDILRGIGLRLWTSCRSHFNKSWQCPKNISIIKGATTKQKGQVNIGGAGIASSAFGTFTQKDRQQQQEQPQQQQKKRPPQIYVGNKLSSSRNTSAHPPPTKTTLIRIIWEVERGGLSSYAT